MRSTYKVTEVWYFQLQECENGAIRSVVKDGIESVVELIRLLVGVEGIKLVVKSCNADDIHRHSTQPFQDLYLTLFLGAAFTKQNIP